MMNPALQNLEAPLSLQPLVENPTLLEAGLELIDVALRLTPGVVLDLLMVDRSARPVVVLGEGSGGAEALLGRSVCVLADVRRMWHLLDRLFPQKGLTFGTDPRIVLIARRFSDSLHGAADLLGPLAIEMVEAREIVVDGTPRLVLLRVGADPTTGSQRQSNGTPESSGARGDAAGRGALLEEKKNRS